MMRLVSKWFVWESEEKWTKVECYLLEDGVVLIGQKSLVFNIIDLVIS